jgi:gas vesicle protein
MTVGITLLTACTLNVPIGTDPAVMTSYFGLLGTVVTVVIAPISMALCTWFLDRGRKKLAAQNEVTAQKLSDKTEQVAQRLSDKTEEVAQKLSDKTEQVAQTLSDKGEQHKEEIVQRADKAYTEANDANAKLNGFYKRLAASEKKREPKAKAKGNSK